MTHLNGKLAHKLKQFCTRAFALRYLPEWSIEKNIVFDFHKIGWYIVESNCKVNFARGFLFEMVITKQVRSKSGNQLEKRVLSQEKEGNIEGGEGEGFFERSQD